MNRNILIKKFFIFFLTTFLLVGSLNSINSGISFDEKHEELNWNFHVKLIKQISNTVFYKKKFDKEKFNEEVESFVGYGIGFQIVSQPIQSFIKNIVKLDKNLDKEGAKLISKHFVVFLFFFISSIFFYLILKKIIDKEKFKIDLEIDGGINFENSKKAKDAGANILVSGSTIFKENNGDLKKNIHLLREN